MNKQSGVLIVLSGPSGVGKGLLRKLISAEIPWLKESVSATTREKRPGEVDGLDYFFVSHDEFRKMIDADQLIEWAEFASNFYGTPKRFVQETLEKGDSILLEIDVQGALQIRRLFPGACLIFLEPPSLEVLETRLRMRNTNHEDDIRARLGIATKELEQKSEFDYIVVNDDLEQCKHALIKLIKDIVSGKRDVPCSSSS